MSCIVASGPVLLLCLFASPFFPFLRANLESPASYLQYLFSSDQFQTPGTWMYGRDMENVVVTISSTEPSPPKSPTCSSVDEKAFSDSQLKVPPFK